MNIKNMIESIQESIKVPTKAKRGFKYIPNQPSRLVRSITWIVIVTTFFYNTGVLWALPSGEVVPYGTVNFDRTTPDVLNISQITAQAIVNYDSFDIAQLETVNIIQPTVNSAILNRILNDVDGTQIAGVLNANGIVFIINEAGVLFDSTSAINVGQLVASSLDISDVNFLAGNYEFDGAFTGEKVINNGVISAAEAWLVGRGVENNGILNVDNLGLASGQKVKIPLGNVAGGYISLRICSSDDTIDNTGSINGSAVSMGAGGDITSSGSLNSTTLKVNSYMGNLDLVTDVDSARLDADSGSVKLDEDDAIDLTVYANNSIDVTAGGDLTATHIQGEGIKLSTTAGGDINVGTIIAVEDSDLELTGSDISMLGLTSSISGKKLTATVGAVSGEIDLITQVDEADLTAGQDITIVNFAELDLTADAGGDVDATTYIGNLNAIDVAGVDVKLESSTGNVNVGIVSAGSVSGDVDIDAAMGIAKIDASSKISGDSLDVRTVMGPFGDIDLNTSVDNLSFWTTTGYVKIIEDSWLHVFSSYAYDEIDIDVLSGDFTFVENVSSASGTECRFTANSGDIAVEADITAANSSLYFDAGDRFIIGSIGYGSVSAGKDVIAEAATKVFIHGDITAGGNVLLDAANDDMFFYGEIVAGENISLIAKKSFTQQGLITAGGTVEAKSVNESIVMSSGSSTRAGGNISYKAGDSIMLSFLQGDNVIVEAVNNIIDAGDSDQDIVANKAQLIAGGDIGNGVLSNGAIDTEVDDIALFVGGSVCLNDRNALTIGNVNAIDVNRVNNDGSVTVVSGTDLAGAVVGDSIKVVAGTWLTVQNDIGAGQDVLLKANYGDLTLNKDVVAGNNISLLASDSIFQNANIMAGEKAMASAEDSIIMADGVITYADMWVAYLAENDIALSCLESPYVGVGALTGDITDNGDIYTDIIASVCELRAGGSVGQRAGTGNGMIDTDVDILAFEVGGSLYLSELDDMALIVSAIAGNNAKIEAGGSIDVGVYVYAGGDVLFDAQGGSLTLDGDFILAGNDVSLYAADDINQSAHVAAGGSVDVNAGRDIVMMDGTVTEAGEDILYEAGNDVALGLLKTSGGVGVIAGNGGVIDANGLANNVEANGFALYTKDDIRLSTDAYLVDDLNIDVNHVALASGGSIYVTGDNLEINDVFVEVDNVIRDDGSSTSSLAVEGLEADDDVDIRVSNNIIGSEVLAGNDVYVDAGGNVNLNSIQAMNGTVMVGGDYKVGVTTLRSLDISAVGDIRVATIRVRKDANIFVGGSLMGKSLDVGGTLNVTEVGNDVEFETIQGGNVIISSAGGDVSAESITSQGQVVLGSSSADRVGAVKVNEIVVESTLTANVIGDFLVDRITENPANYSDNDNVVNIIAGGHIANTKVDVSALGYIPGEASAICMDVDCLEVAEGSDVSISLCRNNGEVPNLMNFGLIKSTVGSFYLQVPYGGLIDGNGSALNFVVPGIAGTFPTILVRDSIGSRDSTLTMLDYDIPMSTIMLDKYGIVGEESDQLNAFWVNLIGTSEDLTTAVSYYGAQQGINRSLPGFVFGGMSGLKLLNGAQDVVREIDRSFSYLKESPELKEKQGVFGSPDFLDSYLLVAQPSRAGFINYIYNGNNVYSIDVKGAISSEELQLLTNSVPTAYAEKNQTDVSSL